MREGGYQRPALLSSLLLLIVDEDIYSREDEEARRFGTRWLWRKTALEKHEAGLNDDAISRIVIIAARER